MLAREITCCLYLCTNVKLLTRSWLSIIRYTLSVYDMFMTCKVQTAFHSLVSCLPSLWGYNVLSFGYLAHDKVWHLHQ